MAERFLVCCIVTIVPCNSLRQVTVPANLLGTSSFGLRAKLGMVLLCKMSSTIQGTISEQTRLG
eukprot:5504512-Amphidinium_carterae.1